jgi:signal recognition particle subunit SEC65
MGYYNFSQDYAVARETEKEIENILENRGYTVLEFCNDKRYDLLLEKNGRKVAVEIKEDFTCEKTGNVGLEFGCRGKPSGISTTEADFYIYKVHTPKGVIVVSISTKTLRKMIEDCQYHRIVSGGDEGSNSRNYLFRLDKFLQYSTIIQCKF